MHEQSILHTQSTDYERNSQHRTTLDNEEVKPYRVQHDDSYELIPLPWNHKSSINRDEMVDFIKPLLLETSEKRNTDSVFRPSVRRSHENLRVRYNDSYESYPYLADTSTRDLTDMNDRFDDASSTLSYSRDQRFLLKKTNDKEKKTQSQMTDHEVADFLSCLLSHDQEDTHLHSKKKDRIDGMSANMKNQSFNKKKTHSNHPLVLPSEQRHSSFYRYVKSNSLPPNTTVYHSSQHESSVLSYSMSSPTHDDMYAI